MTEIKRPNYDFSQEELLNIARDIYNEIPINFQDSGIDELMIYNAIYYDRTLNGYEYAKQLESNGAFDINSIIVEELDCISNKLYNLNKIHIKKWVKENSIQPLYKIGDLVEYKDYRNGSIKEVIKYINEDEAIYHIRISDTESRLIPFENVTKI